MTSVVVTIDCSTPDSAVHHRADDMDSGDERHDGEDVAGSATRLIQDVRHHSHRLPYARVPLQLISQVYILYQYVKPITL